MSPRGAENLQAPGTADAHGSLQNAGKPALGGWLRWLEHCAVHRKGVSSIPSWGAHGRRLPIFLSHIDVPSFLSLSPSLTLSPSFLSPKSKNISSYIIIRGDQPRTRRMHVISCVTITVFSSQVDPATVLLVSEENSITIF